MLKLKQRAFVAIITMAAMLPLSALAVHTEETFSATDPVTEIYLVGQDDKIKWQTTGYSAKGFKVVWSKNSGPTYPLRGGDKYLYYSDPDYYYVPLVDMSAFDGAGAYYVRVCEYLGGECGLYSNEIEVELEAEGDDSASKDGEAVACTMEYAPVCGLDGKTYSNKCMLNAAGVGKKHYGECGSIDSEAADGKSSDEEIEEIEEKAEKLTNNQLDDILAELKSLRDLVKEQQNQINYLQKLLSGVAAVTEQMQDSINQFITYGVDENTQKLGEGERAAVMYSFKEAFGKLPEDESDMAEAIKIANGRWPSKTSEAAEARAQERFREIYRREADMDNANDNAAVTIMAYGLRQKAGNRKLESEQQGLAIYHDLFGELPESTEDWNVLQAITYSGATR